jgi:hypothetical protein
MTSKTTVLAVVISLALTLLLCIGGVIVLSLDGKEAPTALELTATAALGGLIGMLASTRSTLGKNDVEPTVIQGAQAVAPVPRDDIPDL